MSDKTDCQSKISAFIGSVNKLKVNFGHLQGSVLSTPFQNRTVVHIIVVKCGNLMH